MHSVVRCTLAHLSTVSPVSLVSIALLTTACGGLPGKLFPGASNHPAQGAPIGPGAGLAGQDQRTIDMPPRLQWMNNDGYCGEVSVISAGLYFGQYLSQYDARAIASNNANQSLDSSQLLLGVNDTAAATAMHLNTAAYTDTSKDAQGFLEWVRGYIAQGSPVAIGIYMNQEKFYGKSSGGDDEYDHIVPVTGVSSSYAWTDTSYHGDDVLEFSDNGVWNPNNGTPSYAFSMSFDDIQMSRSQANESSAPVYGLADDAANYGLAILGIIDDDGTTLPVQVTTNPNSEPAIKDGTTARPSPTSMTLTVTVSGLTPGVAYKLYKYTSFANVPNSGFNGAASKAAETVNINIASGSTFTETRTIESNQETIFRAVPASAP